MPKKPLLFLDTNVFIFFFQKDPIFGEAAHELFARLAAHKARAVTSVITQLELLSLTTTSKQSDHLLELFLETPNLSIEPISSEIALIAAKLRRSYPQLRTPDALQLACAIASKANSFVTNDKRLHKVKEIDILPLLSKDSV